MEESVDHMSLKGISMEIMLESDEEDASLIEDMEKEERGKNSHVVETKLLNEENFGISNEENVNVDKEEVHVDEIHGSISKANHVDEEVLSCLTGDLEKDFEFVIFSNESRMLDIAFEEERKSPVEQECIGVEYKMDGVQILQLNMSASEVLFAKSAAALRSRKLREARHLSMTAGGETQCPNPAQNYKSYDHLSVSSSKITSRKQRSSQKRKESTVHKKPLVKKTKLCLNNSRALSDEWLQENSNKFSSVSFLCNFCNFSIPFTRNNIEKVLAHITPEVCYYHLKENFTTEVLKDFKENVKMNLMVARNKDKAKIRFVSYLVCRYCSSSFPIDMSHRELIVAHKNKCQYSGESHHQCLFCRRMVHRSTLKKHFTSSAKSYCRDSENIILQLMSCTCQIHAGRHTPVCVVCNKHHWSFLGQHAYQKTVCKVCCDNICSGKTTMLNKRDLLTCALCNMKCSKNFVTYWASDIESLFIGENCIEALKSPMDSTVYEIINMKRIKVKNLLENSLHSLEMGKADSNHDMSSWKLESKSVNEEEDKCGNNNVKLDTFRGTKSEHRICETYPSCGISFSCNMNLNDQEGNCSSKKKWIAYETNDADQHKAFRTVDNEVKQSSIVTGKKKVNCDTSDSGLNSDKNYVNSERNCVTVNFVKEKTRVNSEENAEILQTTSEPSPFAKYSGGFIPLVKSFRFMDKKISPLCATPVEDLPGFSSKSSGFSSPTKNAVGLNSFSTLFQEGKYVLLLPDHGGEKFIYSPLSGVSTQHLLSGMKLVDSVNGIDDTKIEKPKIVNGNTSKHKIHNAHFTKAKNVCKLKKNRFRSRERSSVMSRTGIVESNDIVIKSNNVQQRDSSSVKFVIKSPTSSVSPSKEITSASGDRKSVVIKTRNFKNTDARIKAVPEFPQIANKLKHSQGTQLIQSDGTNIIKVEYSSQSGAKLKYGIL